MFAFLRRLFSFRSVPDSGQPVPWVNRQTLQPGPIQHERLDEKQLGQIKLVHDTFADVDGLSFEERVESFQRDLHLDRELSLSVAMANAYTTYCGTHQLSAKAKRDAYRVLLLRSMASPEEVLKRLRLDEISKVDAVELMNLFTTAVPSNQGMPRPPRNRAAGNASGR